MFDPHPQCAGVAVPSSALHNILRARQSHFEKKSANIDPPSRKSLQRIGNTWKDEWLMSSRGVSREQKAARDSLQNPFQGLSHSTSMRKSKCLGNFFFFLRGRDVLWNVFCLLGFISATFPCCAHTQKEESIKLSLPPFPSSECDGFINCLVFLAFH